jgi:hypothetical protein
MSKNLKYSCVLLVTIVLRGIGISSGTAGAAKPGPNVVSVPKGFLPGQLPGDSYVPVVGADGKFLLDDRGVPLRALVRGADRPMPPPVAKPRQLTEAEVKEFERSGKPINEVFPTDQRPTSAEMQQQIETRNRELLAK